MPSVVAEADADRRAAAEHGVPELRELGEGLRRRGDVVDLDPGHGEADDGARRGHAVVGVALPDAAVQRGRLDAQAVLELGDASAEAVDLGGEGGEAVGLVVADVADARERRSVRRRARRGRRGSERARRRSTGRG